MEELVIGKEMESKWEICSMQKLKDQRLGDTSFFFLIF